ncbi:MAG: hypothetical protein U0414_21330 [Polyangiaceae bacterium]
MSRCARRSGTALLAAGLSASPLERALDAKSPSILLLPDVPRAALLESAERALELFAIPLPAGETEGSFMRRILQNRLV